MTHTKHIAEELKELSPLIAGLNAGHPYQVPPAYFEGLAERILNRVKTQEQTSFLEGADRKTPYTTPPDYFESIAGTIIKRIRDIEAGSPAEELQALSPVLGQVEKKTPFSVPGGYFDELSRDILSGANAIDFVNQQFDPVSAVLVEAKKINVYTIPAGYFDKVPEQVLKKIRQNKPPEVIPMNLRKHLGRYAAAAVITGMMAVAAWMFLQPEPVPGVANDLTAIKKLSNDEIVSYLDNNSIPGAENNNVASFDMKEEDLKELLSDVSDQELQQYLDQHGVAKDMTIN